ncbi:MAG: N-6 DNA methylase [Candidatus Acidiferrales bacterium]
MDRGTYLSSQYNEMQTRTQFISPLLEALGWDVRNEAGVPYHLCEVWEEKGETHGRPDYTLRINGQTKFFLEAKSPSDQLSSADILQTKRYAWNAARGDVFFAAISDFEQFRFFDASLVPNEKSPLDGEAFHLIYKEYDSKIDTLWELSRERVAAGSLDRFLKKDRKSLRQRVPLDKDFLDKLTEWRLELASAIYARNHELDAHQLNDVVQRLLDRLIFIRIAEDRKVIDQRQLWEVVDYWEQSGGRRNIMDFLLDLFHEINENFNGEIFKPHACENISIDSAVLAKAIRELYPPQSNYLFDVVPVELLGSVYERYLGNTLRITSKRVHIEQKPEVRKARGVYYTPEYVVNYIVKNTVGTLVEGMKLKEVERIRILDPACGSGSFLLGAFQRLIDFYIRHLTENPEEARKDPLFPDITRDEGGRPHLSVIRKAEILRNNLYGVDIDPQAVEVTMMSLYLKAIEGERSTLPPRHQVLPPLKDNIRCGNSLIGSDIEKDKALTTEERQRINPFNWNSRENGFGDILKSGGFDAVIGNPPYRRELNYKHLMDEIAGTHFGEKYRAPRMDLWYYFVHRGLEVLRREGTLSFIVNAYWTAGTGAEKLIRALRDTTHIDEIFSLGNLPVFHRVSGQHMIIRVTKARSTAPSTIKFVRQTSETSAEPFVLGKAPVATFTKTPGHLFRGSKLDLQPEAGGILEKISQGTPLRKLGDVRQGIAENPASINKKTNKKYSNRFTVGEGVFALSRKELSHISPSARERTLLRPYHDLKDIGRYRLSDPSLWLIYSTPKTCPRIDRCPRIRAHLTRFRPIMEARRETRQGRNHWWQLHWPRDQRIWESSKILSLQMGTRPAFVAADTPVYVPFSVNVFVPFKSTAEDLKYITALLNSRLMVEWYRHHAKVRGAGLEINGHVLGGTPIRRIDFSKLKEKGIHQRIVELVTRMMGLTQKKDPGKLTADQLGRIERGIAETDTQIDNIVYELYGITDEERKIIET